MGACDRGMGSPGSGGVRREQGVQAGGGLGWGTLQAKGGPPSIITFHLVVK